MYFFPISFYDSSVRCKLKPYFCGGQDISILLSCLKVHIPSLTLIVYISVCVCLSLCISSFLQSTWTTPSWRRTGLTSESTSLRSAVSDTIVIMRSLCTFCQKAEWSLNRNTVLSSFSQCEGEKGSLIYQWTKQATICFTNWWGYFWCCCKLLKPLKWHSPPFLYPFCLFFSYAFTFENNQV